MSEHRATVEWRLSTGDFSYEAYNRDHTWRFEGGAEVPASAAPDFLGNPSRVDPEESFVAAISSCHMLTFLAVASKKRHTVTSYRDSAVGTLERNAEGRLAVTRVVLDPQITFEGDPPSAEEMERIHEKAHHACFIANSVRTEVTLAKG